MKVKPWQMAVIVVGLLVGIGSAVWVMIRPPEVRLASECYLLNVESGEVFVAEMSSKKRLTFPARDPDTGKFTLIRLTKDENGQLYVDDRDLTLLNHLEKDVAVKAVDPRTGDLKEQPKTTRKYVRPTS